MVLSAYDENTRYQTPSNSDVMSWISSFNVSMPVLIDTNGAVDRVYDPSRRSRPTVVLIEPGMVISYVGSGVTDSQIEALLPTAYP